MKSVLTPIAKNVLVPLGLIAVASATDGAIQKKFFGSGTTLVSSNEEKFDIIKILKSLKDAGLSIKGVSETVENELKEQKAGFLDTLASALSANLLENTWAGKEVIRVGEGVIRAGQDL